MLILVISLHLWVLGILALSQRAVGASLGWFHLAAPFLWSIGCCFVVILDLISSVSSGQVGNGGSRCAFSLLAVCVLRFLSKPSAFKLLHIDGLLLCSVAKSATFLRARFPTPPSKAEGHLLSRKRRRNNCFYFLGPSMASIIHHSGWKRSYPPSLPPSFLPTFFLSFSPAPCG